MKLKRWWIVVLIPGVIGVIYLIATALPLGTSSFADSISEKSVRNFVLLTLIFILFVIQLTKARDGS